MLTVARGLFNGIGAMIVTTLLASEMVRDLASSAQCPTAGAFRLTIALVLVLSICATLCALALPKGRTSRTNRL